jgi:hypothetical protein
MSFNHIIFMNNVGKIMGNNVRYNVVDSVNPNDGKCYIFLFDLSHIYFSVLNKTYTSQTLVLPRITSNREALFAAKFICEQPFFSDVENVTISGNFGMDGEFIMFISINDNAMSDSDNMLSDSDNIEDCFENLKIC